MRYKGVDYVENTHKLKDIITIARKAMKIIQLFIQESILDFTSMKLYIGKDGF
jgi:hypothetical protein